jgi:acyl-CoA synthetase (AMP-forming)/AMP-acid ligase II
VSPTEIEEVAYSTGMVGDAVALGVEDDQLGQRVVLAVSPANGALDPEALLAELKQQLPLYMVPKHVVVRPSLPRSPNNKFDRNLLRQELAAS